MAVKKSIFFVSKNEILILLYNPTSLYTVEKNICFNEKITKYFTNTVCKVNQNNCENNCKIFLKEKIKEIVFVIFTKTLDTKLNLKKK